MRSVNYFPIYLLLSSLFITHIQAYSPYLEIRDLLDEGLDENYEQIRALSFKLSDFERYEVYDEYKLEPAVPVLLNSILPLAIGSAVQGDKEGARSIRIREINILASLTGFICCYTMMYSDYDVISTWTENLGAILGITSISPHGNPYFPYSLQTHRVFTGLQSQT